MPRVLEQRFQRAGCVVDLRSLLVSAVHRPHDRGAAGCGLRRACVCEVPAVPAAVKCLRTARLESRKSRTAVAILVLFLPIASNLNFNNFFPPFFFLIFLFQNFNILVLNLPLPDSLEHLELVPA